ncbi:hypothetical protein ES703_08379 [subsurface metagenome]
MKEIRCPDCGKLLSYEGLPPESPELCADVSITIIEKGTEPAKYTEFCLDCGIVRLKKRWEELGCPFTIEMPAKEAVSEESVMNYIVEVVD